MFFEGFFLFVILKTMQRKNYPNGVLTITFLCLYAIFRFILEFFREPEQLKLTLGFLTKGQLLCLPMLAFALIIWHTNIKKRKKTFYDNKQASNKY